MKEKFMNFVGKVRNMDKKTLLRVAGVGVGTVIAVVIANHLVNEARTVESNETYYDVIDGEFVEVSTIE